MSVSCTASPATGHAPVADPCGLAGGTPWYEPSPEEGRYYNTSYAFHGMKGTALKPLPRSAYQPERWKIGGTAEVSWSVWANHGGGYSYRLCPASEPLTEACFQKHPLDFVQDKQQLVLKNGSRILSVACNSKYVSSTRRRSLRSTIRRSFRIL